MTKLDFDHDSKRKGDYPIRIGHYQKQKSHHQIAFCHDSKRKSDYPIGIGHYQKQKGINKV